jgi:hypothetical protein
MLPLGHVEDLPSCVRRKRLHRALSSRRIGLVWNSLAPALKALCFSLDSAFAVSATMGELLHHLAGSLHGLVAIHYWHLKIHQYQPEMRRIRVTRHILARPDNIYSFLAIDSLYRLDM